MVQADTTENAVARATGSIRLLISRGELAPHAPLKQDALAERLGISRTPLRLAIQQLVREGLVHWPHHRTATVAAVTLADVCDVFDMRLAVESIALRAALPVLGKVQLAQAEEWIDAAETMKSHSDLAHANWRFHEALYAPCQRPMLLDTIADLNMRATRAVIIGLSVQSRSRNSQEEHSAILRACRDRDEAGALALLRDHLESAKAAVMASISTEEKYARP